MVQFRSDVPFHKTPSQMPLRSKFMGLSICQSPLIIPSATASKSSRCVPGVNEPSVKTFRKGLSRSVPALVTVSECDGFSGRIGPRSSRNGNFEEAHQIAV